MSLYHTLKNHGKAILKTAIAENSSGEDIVRQYERGHVIMILAAFGQSYLRPGGQIRDSRSEYKSVSGNISSHVVRSIAELLQAADAGPSPEQCSTLVSRSCLFTTAAGTFLDNISGAISCRRCPDIDTSRCVPEFY